MFGGTHTPSDICLGEHLLLVILLVIYVWGNTYSYSDIMFGGTHTPNDIIMFGGTQERILLGGKIQIPRACGVI